MDDGYWSFSFILFLAFILLEAAFYGFGAAIQNLNQGNLEKEMEQGSRKAKRLFRMASQPSKLVNSTQIVTNVIGMVMGAYMLEYKAGRACGQGRRIGRRSFEGGQLSGGGNCAFGVYHQFWDHYPQKMRGQKRGEVGLRAFAVYYGGGDASDPLYLDRERDLHGGAEDVWC